MGKPKRNPVSPLAGDATPASCVLIDGELWESLAEMKPEVRTWFWPETIPAHAFTLIQGAKGVGKSTLLAQLVATMAGSIKMPGMKKKGKPRGTLYLVREESYQVDVLPRLDALKVPRELVHRPKPDPATGIPRRLYLPGELEQIGEMVKRRDIGLIVSDPWSMLMPPLQDGRNGPSEREVLEQVAQFCTALKVHMVAVQHLRKSRVGGALDHGLGSIEPVNVSRAVLRCSKHPSQKGLFVLSRLLINGTGNRASNTYRIKGETGVTQTEWEGSTELSLDEISEGLDSGGEKDEKADATLILKGIIGNEWVAANDIEREGKLAGVSIRTLRDRKAKFNIPSRRVKRGSTFLMEWGPPPDGWPDGDE